MARGSDGSALEPGTTLRTGLMFLDGNWRWLVFRGVLALAVALLAFVLPGNATIVFTFIFAVYCGVDGIASMVAGIRGATNRIHHWGALVMRGMLDVAVAALFILMPLVATVNYALLTLSTLIVWALLSGILEIAAAVRLRKEIEGEWLLGLSGLLSILLGVAIMAMSMIEPIASILSVGWVIGVWATVSGVTLISLGLKLKRRQPTTTRSVSG